MENWIDLIDDTPEVEPIDERHDWHISDKICVRDTQGNESTAIYHVKRDMDVEIWWLTDTDNINTSLIRYWRPLAA